MMKKKSIILIIICLFIFLVIGGCLAGYSYYNNSLKAVDKDSKEDVTFIVNKGETTSTIITNLKKEDLIQDELTMKIYVKLNPGSLIAGKYTLSKSMSAQEIYSALLEGKVTRDTKWVTFVEGKRISYIVDVISKNFDFTKEEIESTLDDKEYLKELIQKYDFLTEDILNEKIYHPLEGYLFADTYEFETNVTLKQIIEKMLSTTESKLAPYKEIIASSNYSIHEIMTLASIVELEGARSDDRAGVAGVFYNRLKTGEKLGSDVTTYYAVNKNFDKDLTVSDLNSCNGYNTRGSCVKGLPIGPIATPSFDSLKATLEPETHDYYFFVADKNGKTYFSKTNGEHESIVRKLKQEGLWYEY